MVDFVASAIIGDMVSRAISHLVGSSSSQHSLENKLHILSHLVIKIHSVIEEAKVRRITNHGLLDWLSKLIDGMYQGRYLLDVCRYGSPPDLTEEHNIGDMASALSNHTSLSVLNPAKRLRVAASSVKKRIFPDDGVGELDRVLVILHGMCGDLSEFIMLMQSCKSIYRPISTNIYGDSQIFGRYIERERLTNFLLQVDASMEQLCVLPIIGDTGVGKTTLVQSVCQDKRVRSHFSQIMLFDFFCMIPMANGDIKMAVFSNYFAGDMGNFNEPIHVLRQNLCNKRFLMVFENINLHTKQMLEVLLPSLGCGKRGSKIIVTSKNKRVASIGTVETVFLKPLPHSEYWFFFKMHAFPGVDIEENPQLVAIGNEIAKKLNGSFFGAKIIGPLLRAHPNSKFWYKVLRSNMEVLSLLSDCTTYISNMAKKFVPSHLKMCKVTVSTSYLPEQSLASIQNYCLGSPNYHRRRQNNLENRNNSISTLHINLCKSVLPFYSLYYTAHCTISYGTP